MPEVATLVTQGCACDRYARRMVFPSATAEPVTIDPTLLALIPIGTVILTIIAGLVGAWIQGRREHKRWLREERLAAYVSFLNVVHHIENETRVATRALVELGEVAALADDIAVRRIAATTDEEKAAVETDSEQSRARVALLRETVLEAKGRITRLKDSLVELSVPFGLLGPASVQAASRAQDSVEPASAESEKAILALEAAMRKALGINDG